MNKKNFDKFMRLRRRTPLGGSGHDAPIIDAFFENFLKAKPTEQQFTKMLNGCLATTKHLYLIWKTK